MRRAIPIFSHIRKPNSVLCDHLSRTRLTARLKRLSDKSARSCIRVRILPFHFCISAKLIPKDSTFFRPWRLCSHLLDHTRRALPSTLLHSFAMGMFGLSTLLRARSLNMTFVTIPVFCLVVHTNKKWVLSHKSSPGWLDE